MTGWEQDGGDEKYMKLGAEKVGGGGWGVGQKIKPCRPHLLSCSSGAAREECECAHVEVCFTSE